MSIQRHKEKLSYKNMDYYYPLNLKRELIRRVAKDYFQGKSVLDIGCGEMPYKSIFQEYNCNYLGLDIENPEYQKNIKPDLFWNGEDLPIENESIDNIVLIEVLEHLSEPRKLLQESNSKLKKGGLVLITVPFLWNLHDIPNDFYRYTPFALKELIEQAGFEQVELSAFGGWNSSLATMLALYTRRAMRGKKYQRFVSKLAFPIVKKLYQKDVSIKFDSFDKELMPTGLWCIARKK